MIVRNGLTDGVSYQNQISDITDPTDLPDLQYQQKERVKCQQQTQTSTTTTKTIMVRHQGLGIRD